MEASRSEIDDLDRGAALLPQKDILGLHIAVDDLLPQHDSHALQDGVSEASHQMNAKALIVVLLDQLIQVDPKYLKRDAKVIAEVKVLFHVNNIQRALAIQILQMLQNVHLHHALLLESLLTANDLHSHMLLPLVIKAPQDLSKTTLAQQVHHFVSIRNVSLFTLTYVPFSSS